MTDNTSGYWLDLAVADILKAHPKGEIVVSTGISPSGPYHLGHMREMLTADAVVWALQQQGRQVRHLHFVDDLDPLRKRYPFLPDSYEQWVGRPLSAIPDPAGCHGSYAEHYVADFKRDLDELGVKAEILHSHQLYREGKFDTLLAQAIEQRSQTRRVIEEVSQRPLEPDWSGVMYLDKQGYRNLRVEEWPELKDQAAEGRLKLSWRLDWPARWHLYGVGVEPFGREHATKGGSYDTGARIVKLWGSPPPHPIAYETINLIGETKKMSSSLGNLVTSAEALKLMPTEIMRYFVLKSRPAKTLVFDPGLGLYNLIDEFSKVESTVRAGQTHAFAQAYAAAVGGTPQQTIASVPFNHLVSVHQAAGGRAEIVFEILQRTGYAGAVDQERAVLERELKFVAHWLAHYAPDEVKFSVQTELPQVELSEQQQQFLQKLAEKVVDLPAGDGQAMHDAIYAAKEEVSLEPAEAFQAIYRVILGQDHGPKAGWFLASLEPKWLIKRLNLVG